MINFNWGNFCAICTETAPTPPPISTIVDPASKLSQGNPEDQKQTQKQKSNIDVEILSLTTGSNEVFSRTHAHHTSLESHIDIFISGLTHPFKVPVIRAERAVKCRVIGLR
jgi:hypothetical protein